MNNNFNINNDGSNQNYNFDPMTGRPIKDRNGGNNKNSKIIIIFAVIIIIGVCIFSFTKVMKSSDEKKQSDIQQNDQNSNDKSNNTNEKVDSNKDLTYDKTGAFLMPVEDVYTITGKGIAITGRIERGSINIGDTIQIIGLDHEIITTTIVEIEKFRNKSNFAEAGEYTSIILKDVERKDVEIGQVLVKPDSIKTATKFDAEIYILSTDEGGRHTPFFNNYRPQFYFRIIDIAGVITLPDDKEMINPGEKAIMTVKLDRNVAMEKGTTFSVREGGRIIGKGTIIKVY